MYYAMEIEGYSTADIFKELISLMSWKRGHRDCEICPSDR